MPTVMRYAIIIVAVLALIPPVMIALARAQKSTKPRIHLIQDMDNQARFKAQSLNPLFADTRAMRPAVPGTVARGMLNEDAHFHEGKVGDEWASIFPIPVDAALMRRGRERFDIYCTPCHGYEGSGNGIVNVRADKLMEGTWIPPTSLHVDQVRSQEHGKIYNTIANGIRKMPAYGDQIAPHDRWAVVAYVRALQRSQNAKLEDVPQDVRASLK